MAEPKLTLGDLRKQYNEIHQASIRISDVAQLANVSIGDVYTTEAGGFVSKYIVERVVRAFSLLSHQDIRIQDITVHITDMSKQIR